jgi:acetyl-CoA synthetase
MANSLRRAGVRKYDVVTLYMPMVPQIIYAMLACARLGATHSVVFAGFSADGLASRINDAKSMHVVTTDQGVRGGKIIPLKRIVDEALRSCPQVQNVFVTKRTGADVPMKPGRDIDLDDEMANVCVHPLRCGARQIWMRM